MDEQLKKYLEEFVGMLKEGGQFALEQLPEFVHEYLTYYAWYHGFWATTLFCLMGLVVVLWYKGCKYNYWDEDVVFPLSLVSIMPFMLVAAFFFMNLLDFIKVTVTPRLYLIENLLELVN